MSKPLRFLGLNPSIQQLRERVVEIAKDLANSVNGHELVLQIDSYDFAMLVSLKLVVKALEDAERKATIV